MSNEVTAKIKGTTLTDVSLTLAKNTSLEQWKAVGSSLGSMERAVGWWVGDWWNQGEPYGDRVSIVKDASWTGPSHKTCQNYGSVAKKFDPSQRREGLTFAHHSAVASLPPEKAQAVLADADRQRQETGEAPPSRQVAQIAKADRRDERAAEMADRIEAASQELGDQLFGVICADPPWRFEPHSRKTGMDRAADNHYPTMTTEEIEAIDVPAADDCVLFLWATSPMLIDALDVMAKWDFEYKSSFIWAKNVSGTGYWNRNRHELLLVGVRGNVPAPDPSTLYDSVIEAPRGAHSEKPALFYEMIEGMFPDVPRLEMFARDRRPGWTAHGTLKNASGTEDGESGGDGTADEHRDRDTARFRGMAGVI